MPLSVTPEAVAVLSNARADGEAFLGVIDVDDQIWLVRASSHGVRTHEEWIRVAAAIRPSRGFSFSFWRGCVHFLRASMLNDPQHSYLLESGLVQEVRSLLELGDDPTFRLFDH